MRTLALVCLAALALAGCNSTQKEPPTKETALEQLRNDIKEVAARDERKADTIEVQHLLVAHKDAGIPGVTRSMADAERLAPTSTRWSRNTPTTRTRASTA